MAEVISAGPLSAVPVRLAIRRPGIGGASPQPVPSGGLDAGRGWTVRPAPGPGACEWTRCYPPGGPDLGYLATGHGAVLEHPEHGTARVPAGSWVVRVTGARRAGNG